MTLQSFGQPIAQGRTAEIYAWHEGWILKLFYEWFGADSIEYEAQVARAVSQAGLPVPAVGEIIEVEGRRGLLYERVDGPTMLEALGRRPWTLFDSARQLAKLQVEMHTADIKVPLPAQRQRIAEKLQRAKGLPAGVRQARLDDLAKLPAGDRLCHGDFHPDNVIITERGPVVIDWMDAALGNPLADVARTSVILQGVKAYAAVSWLQRVLVGWYERLYRRHYFALQPGGAAEYWQWLPIVAAARMEEGMDDIEDWLLAQAQAKRGGKR
jgi:aminoglycoside phosphotransferase (APT) family kinase protein